MSAAFWLAGHELMGRKGAFVMGSIVVAVVVSFCVGGELIGRAKGQAVRTELDRMGPSLRLIPPGKSASDLARNELGSTGFDRSTMAAISSALLPVCRTLDDRLLVRESIEGQPTLVIGVDPAHTSPVADSLDELEEGAVILGLELARRLGRGKGETISVGDQSMRIVGILAGTASGEDFAAFVLLESLRDSPGRDGAVNLVDVYPRHGVVRDQVIERLGSLRSQINVLVVDQDRSAVGELEQGLDQHRQALYVVTALMIAICICIWSYLSAVERRMEAATLFALGCDPRSMLLVLATQAAIVGFVGALLGYALGVAVALAQDFQSARGVVLSLQLVFAVEVGVILTSVLGSLPAALLTGYQNHVAVLQDA